MKRVVVGAVAFSVMCVACTDGSSASESSSSSSSSSGGIVSSSSSTSAVTSSSARPSSSSLVSSSSSVVSSSSSFVPSSSSGPEPAPVPTLDETNPLEPASVVEGSADFTLTVHGTGFVPSSKVQWNGQERTTFFRSATNLTADISANDVMEGGMASVTVVTPAPGGGVSRAAPFTIDLAQPVIDAVTPRSVVAGSAGFTLVIGGRRFHDTSVARWNGSDRPTTFISSTELQATISASDVVTAGTNAITVFTPGPGGGASNSVDVTVENPLPVLSGISPTSITAGRGAFTLVVTGAAFNASSVVQWNGSDRPTTSISATELHAAISAEDVLAAGTATVTVVAPAPGGGTSSPSAFTIWPVGILERVSLSTTNEQGNQTSWQPALSATGRYVAFASDATNLVDGDTWGVGDVFVRDTCVAADEPCAPMTYRVSVSPGGGDAFSHSAEPSISANGRYVAFTSSASNLVTEADTNGVGDVFVRDTCIGAPAGCMPRTVRASVNDFGVEGNDTSDTPAISADGRFVAFRSTATNLVSGDTNGRMDIFVRDTCFNTTDCIPTTIRASLSTGNMQADGQNGAERPAISSNGRYVVFSSLASNLGESPDTNARGDIYLRDTCANTTDACAPTTIRISVAMGNAQADGSSSAPSISWDGRFVAFESRASNLVANDTNGADIFVRDTCIGAPAGCMPSTERVSLTADGMEANGFNLDPVISLDGRYVAWVTYAANLQMGGSIGAVVRDTCRGVAGCTPFTNLITRGAPGGTEPVDIYGSVAMSADGRVAAFVDDQAGIVLNDTNGARDVFNAFTGF